MEGPGTGQSRVFMKRNKVSLSASEKSMIEQTMFMHSKFEGGKPKFNVILGAIVCDTRLFICR